MKKGFAFMVMFAFLATSAPQIADAGFFSSIKHHVSHAAKKLKHGASHTFHKAKNMGKHVAHSGAKLANNPEVLETASNWGPIVGQTYGTAMGSAVKAAILM